MQQLEARRLGFSEELLSLSETRQYDNTARDAVRLQREIQSGNPDSGLDFQECETATSKGEPENVRIGVKEDLHRDKPLFVKPMLSKVKLGTQ